jgi:hypothetical protein
MNDNPYYPYDHTQASRYTFTSIGKKNIKKAVDFTHTGIRNIVNIGFGDLLTDDTIDVKANSNNGDIVKVLATAVQILIDFTSKFPESEMIFSGSTKERTKLYFRMLRTYYAKFSKEFIIKGVIKEGLNFLEFPFEPKSDLKYIGFIVKRIY